MLFVALFKLKAGTPQEATARRLQWQHPEGTTPIAEYWTESSRASVIAIFEAESNGVILGMTADWSDIFDIDVYPCVTAEQGLQMARARREG